MVKIDVKDKKILYQLEWDSRQSFRSIGRKVGLSKDVVAARVKKLEEMGIIQSYIAYIFPGQLGYIIIRFYFKFQYISPEKKQEIINHFVNSDLVIVVASLDGSYDLIVNFAVKNLDEFNSFYQKTLLKYRDYFYERQFSIYLDEYRYDKAFLLEKETPKLKPKFLREIVVGIDDLDKKILKIIAPNARAPTMEIAQKLGVSPTVIKYRMKKLSKMNLLQGYSIIINYAKLGYHWMKVDIDIKKYAKVGQIIKYVEKNPHLIYVDFTVGHADLEFEFLFKNLIELNKLMEDLSIKFPNIIKNYKQIMVIEVHKLEYIPQK